MPSCVGVLTLAATHSWNQGPATHLQWDLSSCDEPSSHPQADLLQALDALVNRVQHDLTAYESVVTALNDKRRLAFVSWARDWLARDGAAVIQRLRSTIVAAPTSYAVEMGNVIGASLQLGDLTKQRDLGSLSNWDLVWEWSLDILPALELAFERFAVPSGGLDSVGPSAYSATWEMHVDGQGEWQCEPIVWRLRATSFAV